MLEKLLGFARREGLAATPEAVLTGCGRLLDESGDADYLANASQVIQAWKLLSPADRLNLLVAINSRFGPDPQGIADSALKFARSGNATDFVTLSEAMNSPRLRIVRRLASVPDGAAAVVSMRESILQHLTQYPELQAFDTELLALLDGWFSVGLLQLAQVDWSSSAALLEKLIEHEAVHAVDGWSDLRRRLQPDRRCFAFFHPAMPEEPLIFVEVALLDERPDALAPLLNRRRVSTHRTQAYKVAAFYSISHCHPGLHGVRLGHFLISRVVQELRVTQPSLDTFCTLSPVPGFARWLHQTRRIHSTVHKPAVLESLNDDLAALRDEFGRRLQGLIDRDGKAQGARQMDSPAEASLAAASTASAATEARALQQAEKQRRREDQSDADVVAAVTPGASEAGWLGLRAIASADPVAPEYRRLRRLCAHYLTQVKDSDGRHPDPVARFHLRNGASLDRINLVADRSDAAMAQSFGMMVNYVYDLAEIEKNHRAYQQGDFACAREISQLIRRA